MHARTFFRAAKLRGIVDVAGLMAGVDEVGRGPLAGPVIAAAVILEEKRMIRGLNDSKLLTPDERERLDREIRKRAVCVSVASASVAEIDSLNILRAALLAMQRAVEALEQQPQIVLVDGNQRPQLTMPVRTVVGGDARVRSISAASIVAKVHRDHLCMQLHEEHPQYGFDSHKGYSTPEHLIALLEHGACPHHRRSFAPVRNVLDRLF
ncbi:MAG TPA: ribonuclease HII [Caldimonas sp.]|jgi:ribonuclease HII